MAGFSGIAATTWEEDASTMSGKSNAGAPSAVMSLKSGKIVLTARSIAGQSKDRRYSIGPTIRAGSKFAHAWPNGARAWSEAVSLRGQPA